MGRRLAALKAQWGFEGLEVRAFFCIIALLVLPFHLEADTLIHIRPRPRTSSQLRVDWAAEHLLVALQRLEEALHEYYGQERASGACFAGLELVVAQVCWRASNALMVGGGGRLTYCIAWSSWSSKPHTPHTITARHCPRHGPRRRGRPAAPLPLRPPLALGGGAGGRHARGSYGFRSVFADYACTSKREVIVALSLHDHNT